MAEYFISDTTLEAIADAIRLKTGGMSKLSPASMVTAMEPLAKPSGTFTARANGEYDVSAYETAIVRAGSSKSVFGYGFAADTGTLNITDPDNPLPNEDGSFDCPNCDGTGVISEPCMSCGGTGTISEICPTCGGSGTDPETGDPCETCGGSGYIDTDCPTCGGSGVTEMSCPECDGTGHIWINDQSDQEEQV